MAANAPRSWAGDRGTPRLPVAAGKGIGRGHRLWLRRRFGDGRCPAINHTGGTEVSGGLLGDVPALPTVPAGFNAVPAGVRVDVLDDAGDPVRDQVGDAAALAPFVGATRAFWQDRAGKGGAAGED